jgi:hypothetical protein
LSASLSHDDQSDTFANALEYKSNDGEHPVEFFEVYREYLNRFESKIEVFIRDVTSLSCFDLSSLSSRWDIPQEISMQNAKKSFKRKMSLETSDGLSKSFSRFVDLLNHFLLIPSSF